MNEEDNIYGLIANTIAAKAEEGDCTMTAKLWSTGTVPDGIADTSNTNRTILKIIDTGKPEPIKAKAYYDETEEKIKVEVTFTKNGIAKIEDKKGNILSKNSTTADTGEELIGNGTYKYLITDGIGNKRQITLKVTGLSIYIIPDLETLKEFRDEVNAGNNFYGITVIQTADIEMNSGKYTIDEETKEITFTEDSEKWVPIGDYSNNGMNFRGTYDGREHKISGIYIDNENASYQGLFGFAHNNSVIKNLNIEKSKIIGESNIGAITGQSYGTIENCSNTAEVHGTSGYVGGICGHISGSNAISNCYNAGNISGTSRIGGICGYINNSIKLANCYNTGNVSATGSYIGGIVGYNNATTNNNQEIINCYNTGYVTTTLSDAGGIVGHSTVISIISCYNVGNIESEDNCAGICGFVGNRGTISNCYNTGKINCKRYSGGGILGCNKTSNLELTNCYNKGDVTTNASYAGGIVGNLGNRMRVISCYNTGNILSKKSYAGGIGGYGIVSATSGGTQDSWSTINKCYNIETVTGVEYVGGILGIYSGSSYTSFLENYNLGKVEGISILGSIIGESAGTNNCTDCYYETGTANDGIGKPSGNTGCTQTTREDVISKIKNLDAYKNDIYNINNGLPILSWQTDNDKLNLINGDNAFVEDTQGINNGYPILAWQSK